MRRLIHWEKYDPAIHNTGQIITWKLTDTQQCKSKTKIHTQDDTEAMDLTGPQEVERGRKRKRNDQASLIAQRKVCCNRGLSYSPRKKAGVRRPRKSKREIKPPCPVTCKYKCTRDVKEDERKEIFDTFWSYGDLIKCRQAICNTIEVKAKERSRGSGTKNRQSSIFYKLNGKRVCKTMFLNTYSIRERFVRTCVDKLDDAGVQEDDNMGKSGNHSYSAEAIEEVKNHIKSFPVIESHYVRERSKRCYLSSQLNVSKMYDLYCAKSLQFRLALIPTDMYLIPVLTLAFSNQKKINAIHAANLRMHCPTRKENSSKNIQIIR